ncbi:hypothetical protein EC968_010686, partial [Mortierella alpina]
MTEPSLAKLSTPSEIIDKRITVFVFFEGIKYEALLDTGATDTCIRKDIALKHKKVITPIEGVINLADVNKTVPRIGRTENIELHY